MNLRDRSRLAMFRAVRYVGWFSVHDLNDWLGHEDAQRRNATAQMASRLVGHGMLERRTVEEFQGGSRYQYRITPAGIADINRMAMGEPRMRTCA